MDIGETLSEGELCPPHLLTMQEEAFSRDIERILARQAEFVNVPCPACLSTTAKSEFIKYGFHFDRCVDCLTIYMNPRPSVEILADYYANSENYAIWAKYIFPASESVRREKVYRPWLERVIHYCDEFAVERGTLVEVGPGFGTFAEVANTSGSFSNVHVVEPTPELAEACRLRGVRVIEKRIEDVVAGDLPLADVVVAFEVIEHLFSPDEFLVGLSGLLRPNGLLFLSCPNGEGFDISLLGADALAVDAEHVNLFNPQSMSLLLDRCGLEVVVSTTPGRLDAEFVREAAMQGTIQLDAFLQRVLIDDWDNLGWDFQRFLADSGLSSHMWTIARKKPPAEVKS
jgi:2-polyprenyl-3-methyl-5-hydroxy-6-metoxy-1,4-benzoquinol methylase